MMRFLTLTLRRTAIACIVFIFEGTTQAQDCAYCEANKMLCSEAFDYYKKNQFFSDYVRENLTLSPAFVFSIVAPEITQYMYLQDKLETMASKVLYINVGNDYGNFSLGIFQMKPSFIEDLEKEVKADSALTSFRFILPDSSTSERDKRMIRIDRLEDENWQIKYLCLFSTIIQLKYSKTLFPSESEKLKFFATAYNTGFNKPESTIRIMQEKKFFPHFSTDKFSYSEISVCFFKELEE